MRIFILAGIGSAALALAGCGGDNDETPTAGGTGSSIGGSAGATAGHGGSPGGGVGAKGGTSSLGGKSGTGGTLAGSGVDAGAAGESGSGGTGGPVSQGGKGGGGNQGGGGSSAGADGESAGVGGNTTGSWKNATGNLANMPSECGNLGLVVAQPGTDMVIAGVAQKGLWATHDGGATWTALGTGPGSDTITNRISSIVWDPEDPTTFWESGIYNAGGVYKTTDNGVTFKQVGTVTHNDSVSIDLTDPNRKTMLAGAHEATQKLFLSTDAGANWMDIGASLPADAGYCTATHVLDAQTFLVGCNGNGIYRSENAGDSWTRVGTTPVLPQPLIASDGSIYWAGAQGGIEKGDRDGLAFDQVADGNTAAAVVAPTTLAELPDGRIVTIGKDHLQASADDGRTWTPLGDPLPYMGGGFNGATGVTYSALTKTFFTWHWTCDTNVQADAIMSLTLD